MIVVTHIRIRSSRGNRRDARDRAGEAFRARNTDRNTVVSNRRCTRRMPQRDSVRSHPRGNRAGHRRLLSRHNTQTMHRGSVRSNHSSGSPRRNPSLRLDRRAPLGDRPRLPARPCSHLESAPTHWSKTITLGPTVACPRTARSRLTAALLPSKRWPRSRFSWIVPFHSGRPAWRARDRILRSSGVENRSLSTIVNHSSSRRGKGRALSPERRTSISRVMLIQRRNRILRQGLKQGRNCILRTWLIQRKERIPRRPKSRNSLQARYNTHSPNTLVASAADPARSVETTVRSGKRVL